MKILCVPRPSLTHLLQYRDDGRFALLEEVKHHEDVRVGGERPARRVTDVTQLSEVFHCIAKALKQTQRYDNLN